MIDILINLQQRDECKTSDKMADDKTDLLYNAYFTSTFVDQVALSIRLHTVTLCYDIADMWQESDIS